MNPPQGISSIAVNLKLILKNKKENKKNVTALILYYKRRPEKLFFLFGF